MRAIITIVIFLMVSGRAYRCMAQSDPLWNMAQKWDNNAHKKANAGLVSCSQIWNDAKELERSEDILLNDPLNDPLYKRYLQQGIDANNRVTRCDCTPAQAQQLATYLQGFMWKANKIDELRKQGGKPTGDAAGASGASAGQGVYVPKKNAAAEGIAGKGKEYEQQYGGKHYDLGNGKDVAAAHQKVSKVTGGAEGSDDAMSFDNVPESEALKATYNTDVNPPIKTTNLNNGSQHKGTHIKQNISGGRGYSNKVMYIDDNVTVTYSLRLIRDTTCFTLKTSGTYTESDDY